MQRIPLALFFAALVRPSTADCSSKRIGAFNPIVPLPACAAQTAVVAVKTKVECAMRCALADATVLFRKFVPGAELTISDRRLWVFQQRKNGTVDFARSWSEYEQGFGDNVEFWSGLRTLALLTKRANVTLRVEMITLNGTLYVAEWSNFTVGDASTNYTMNYSQYLTGSSNVTGDCLIQNKGMQFSTMDRDHDTYPGDCSMISGNSGFWFKDCTLFGPNNQYSNTEMRSPNYMSNWYIYPGKTYSTLREMRMMLQLS